MRTPKVPIFVQLLEGKCKKGRKEGRKEEKKERRKERRGKRKRKNEMNE